jgi:hypothetical protein
MSDAESNQWVETINPSIYALQAAVLESTKDSSMVLNSTNNIPKQQGWSQVWLP